MSLVDGAAVKSFPSSDDTSSTTIVEFHSYFSDG